MIPKDFFAELKRRNVYKVAVAYAVAGWALAQGIAQVFPVFDIPNWVVRLIVVLIIIGLPIALTLAWMFELTPQGIAKIDNVDFWGAHVPSRADCGAPPQWTCDDRRERYGFTRQRFFVWRSSR